MNTTAVLTLHLLRQAVTADGYLLAHGGRLVSLAAVAFGLMTAATTQAGSGKKTEELQSNEQ
jgi:hypothetical protein